MPAWRFAFCLLAVGGQLSAENYSAPAGIRAAMRRPSGATILPGGRVIAPLGGSYITGPGPFGIVVAKNARTVVTSNAGPDRSSLTILERERKGPWNVRHLVAPKPPKGAEPEGDEWRSVFMGLALAPGDRAFYASEGNSGRVRLLDVATGYRRRVYDLNQGGFSDSYTGDLALDAERNLLFVVDQANFRLAAIDVRKQAVVGSVRLGRLPFAVALSPDGRRAYVTNIGMFEYQALPGAAMQQARETGIPFPAFGFPSPEAERGNTATSARGEVKVPALGNPNARESNSLAVVDVADPAAMKVAAFIRTGQPFGGEVAGGSSPSGVAVSDGKVYVSNAHNDTITVVDAASLQVEREIAIRIPGLEKFRGVLPIGLTADPKSGWLLVAEAGINALGVIDMQAGEVLGHLPAGWFPTRTVVEDGVVHVANARGSGVGPNNISPSFVTDTFGGTLRRGSVSIFPLPAKAELAAHTRTVLQANGLVPRPEAPPPLPAGIRHIVVIVKENRTFDEVLGDVTTVSNGAVMAAPALARFGRNGYASGYGDRLSLHHLDVTPNHHAIALGWSFSDNFYADSDVSVDGHHWLVGSYPNAWTQSTLMAAYAGQKDFRLSTAPGRLLFAGSDSSVHPEEQPEAGTLWHHLARHGISFRNFGEGFELAGVDEGAGLKPTGARFLTNVPMPRPLFDNTSRDYPGFNMNIPDQYRAAQFIREITERYVRTGAELPRLLFLHLPNDHMTKPRPADGFPYEASYVADNDYALGRILEFLSGTKWWNQMTVFVTEDDAQGGRDHIDAHRTVLLAAGPWVKRNYVSHTHTSFPGLLKTVFRLLGLPPLNLFDAAASDLSDLFAAQPDLTGYRVAPVDPRLFDPAKARDPLDPTDTTRMDDAEEIRRQQRR